MLLILRVDSLIEECDRAIEAPGWAATGDLYRLGRVLGPLMESYGQRTDHPRARAVRGIFVRRYPAADGPLAAFDAMVARVKAIAAGRGFDWSNVDILWELDGAARALKAVLKPIAAAIEAAAEATPIEPPVVGSQATLLKHLRYKPHYPGKLAKLAAKGDIRLEALPPAEGEKEGTWRMVVLSERAYKTSG